MPRVRKLCGALEAGRPRELRLRSEERREAPASPCYFTSSKLAITFSISGIIRSLSAMGALPRNMK